MPFIKVQVIKMIWKNNNQPFLTIGFNMLIPVFFIFFLVNNIQAFGEDDNLSSNKTLPLL